jgi:hypothetical protein
MTELNPQPLPPGPPQLKVNITSDMAWNLEQMQQIVADVMAQSGCPGCHSGRSIIFNPVDTDGLEEYEVDPETLAVSKIIGLRGD